MNAMTSYADLPACDDALWEALCRRDRDWDGRFLYGVLTTGIFCKPSCASRRPNRDNVRFFANPQRAQMAGLRACLRCRPLSEATGPGWIEQVCRRLEAEAEAPGLDDLAREAGLSSAHLQKSFSRVVGLSPYQYRDAIRRQRLTEALDDGQSVTSALYEAGFGSASRFYEAAESTLGMKPAVFARGGPGEVIGFATAHCRLGRVLAARTEVGLCAILLGDEDAELIADLRTRFSRADLRPSDSFGDVLAEVVALIDDPRGAHTLPLDIRGTAFQQRVWKALQQIPAGETRSYSELADMIGAPKAARAVAGACAANRLAIAIPCHRVVRGNGDLSGYRWGQGRKRDLLRLEAQGVRGEGGHGSDKA